MQRVVMYSSTPWYGIQQWSTCVRHHVPFSFYLLPIRHGAKCLHISRQKLLWDECTIQKLPPLALSAEALKYFDFGASCDSYKWICFWNRFRFFEKRSVCKSCHYEKSVQTAVCSTLVTQFYRSTASDQKFFQDSEMGHQIYSNEFSFWEKKIRS